MKMLEHALPLFAPERTRREIGDLVVIEVVGIIVARREGSIDERDDMGQ